SGSFLWLWAFSKVFIHLTWLGWIREFTVGQTAAGLAIVLLVYLLAKPEKGMGCLAVALGFPFYVLFWPITVPFLLWSPIGTAFDVAVKKSQNISWVFTSYSLAFLAFLILNSRLNQRLWWVAAVLLGASYTLIFLSLITWVFNPLAWVSTVIRWIIQLSAKHATGDAVPSINDFLSQPASSKDKLKKALKQTITIHAAFEKFPAGSTRVFQDAFVALAFARKFIVSLIGLAFVIGMGHYTLQLIAAGAAFSGLQLGPVRNTWFEYTYSATMNLLTADSGIAPLTRIARVLVLLNVMTGVSLLVFLVTVFSMVTRERARNSVTAIAKMIENGNLALETKIFMAVVMAHACRAWDSEIQGELAKLRQFRVLPINSQYAVRGVQLFETVIDSLQTTGSDNATLARALTLRGKLPEDKLVEFGQKGSDQSIKNVEDLIKLWVSVCGTGGP
ncbi:MAG TPA: hypothetical protein VGU64_01865, partial [Terriglobales bacterium]|nr:hypothetical protein [Terriglobales bacterium]